MKTEEIFMYRCIELAKQGAGSVAPNPMVGAVLVHEDRIIGEGFHQHYGEAHAEVNCIASVKAEDSRLIPHSTLFVSLEPCAHHGKTPPCADLIIQKKIPKVVIGCRDPFEQVNGKGIEKLLAANVEVHQNILEEESKNLNQRFFTFHTKFRPFIILKWAESNNSKIGSAEGKRIFISNDFTNRLVHKWRSEEAAILVGTNTAALDDPELTVRQWNGRNPIRIVLDMNLRLPHSLKLFNDKSRTIIFNTIKNEENGNLQYFRLDSTVSIAKQITDALYHSNIQSVLVEGGAKLMQSFIDEGLWDEARIIKNKTLTIEQGTDAPMLTNQKHISSENIFSDSIDYYKNLIS